MVGLLNLPGEILSEIVRCLCHHCYPGERCDKPGVARYVPDHASIRSISKTCKVLQAVSQPIAYHSVCVGQDKCVLLIRLLAQRPDLARSVRQMNLNGVHGDEPEVSRGKCKTVLTPDDIIFLGRLMEELPINTDGKPDRISPRWHMEMVGKPSKVPRVPAPLGHVDNRPIYVLAALTLSLIPNVESFAYAQYDQRPFISCGSGSLGGLTELLWVNTSWGDGPELRDVMAAAPKLKHLYGDGGFSVHSNLNCSQLKTLELECAGLDGEGLRDFVQKIDGLESFSYRFNSTVPGPGFAKPRHVYEALISARDTLTTLNLSFTSSKRQMCILPPHLHIQTLQDLSALERVHLSDAVIFWGRGDEHTGTRGPYRLTQALPPSIREFSLDLPIASQSGFRRSAELYDEPYPHLFHLAESIPEQFPNLTVVRIQKVIDTMAERLEIAFSQRGVAITVQKKSDRTTSW